VQRPSSAFPPTQQDTTDQLKAEVARLRGETIALASEVRELKARLKGENNPQNALVIPAFLGRAS
jgi:hypothetical protein